MNGVKRKIADDIILGMNRVRGGRRERVDASGQNTIFLIFNVNHKTVLEMNGGSGAVRCVSINRSIDE